MKTPAEMTRDERIAHLVTVATQWSITDTKGQPITAATFAKATDAWLLKQVKAAFREGERCAQ